jgi:hypothetical protein
MTKLEANLLALFESASEFVSQNGNDVPVFSSFPEWPPETAFPVQTFDELPIFKTVSPDPFLRAVAYRQKHDPDEKSKWAFAPNRAGNRVWLVRVSRFDPSNN